MGYGESECLICYCVSGCNGGNGNIARNICPECFFKTGATALRGNTWVYAKVDTAKCNFCEQILKCIMKASVCQPCSDGLNPEGRKLVTCEREESEEEDPRDLFFKTD